MSALTVIIDGYDYTALVEELKLTINGLNADGSGRDVQTGLMTRTKITDKWKAELKMLRLYETDMNRLKNSLQKVSYRATAGAASGTFYTDTIPFGSQRYDKSADESCFDGVSFTMTEM